MAPPSQPGTSTQTTVTSAGPPAATTAGPSVTGSRLRLAEQTRFGLVRHDPDDPRRARGARGGCGEAAAFPRRADDRDHGRRARVGRSAADAVDPADAADSGGS